MKCLFITKHDPFSIGGGSYASHAYLKVFSEISRGNIDICIADCCNQQSDDIQIRKIYYVPDRNYMNKLLSIITGEMHRYTSFVIDLLKKHHNEYDLCIFDHSSVAGTLVKYTNKYNIKSVTIHHNFEIEYFNANINNIIKKKIFLYHVMKNEKKAYKNSSYNFFLTNDDFLLFKKYYGDTDSNCSVIGCFEFEHKLFDINSDRQSHKKSSSPTFLITGTLSCVQTEDAISFFFSKLYPFIPKDSSVIIAGRDPSNQTINLCAKYSNIELIQNPVNMQSVLNKGDIYICPTRCGGGLKLRVMDGLKSGMPIISHAVSSRGYEYLSDLGFLYSFKTPNEFEKCLKIVLKKYEDLEFDKKKIIDSYEKYFSFNSGLERVKNVLLDDLH